MIKRFSTILVFILTFGFLLSTGSLLPAESIHAQSDEEVVLFQANFEEGPLTDWSLEQGWEVIEANGNHFLQGSQHTWASIRDQYWNDFLLKLRVHIASGAGLHVNFRVSGIYRYFFGIRESSIYLMKQLGPNQFEELSIGEGNFLDWHAYEIRVRGNHIQVFADGEIRIEYTDSDVIPSGGIAFENLETSPSWVDDIEIWGKPRQEPESTGSYQWVRTGGPLGGLGYDVRIHPDNPQLMYVSDAFAGVFISEDAGKTWLPSNQGITTRTGNTGDGIPIFSLTIDPNNPEILWVGTQNQRGIFKSIDGGHSWQQLVNGVTENGISFRGFTVQPGDSNIVYAAGEISSWEWNDGQESMGREFDMVAGVVYKTTNGGAFWEKIWEGDNLARYIWINPQDGNILYVSTGIFDREAANSNPQQRLAGGEGVLKSVDGGKTWRNINNGLNNLYVGSLYMHPENPDVLMAGTGNNQYWEHNGVYITADGGETWVQTLFDDNINSVEFFEADPSFAYAGSSHAIYFSKDGGYTWQKMSQEEDGWGPPGIRAGFPIDFQIDPGNPLRIFANNYGGGNFLSEDGGVHWTAASTGYTGAQVRHIAVDPTQPAHVIATARSGIFESFDGGSTWNGIGYPPAFNLEWNVVAFHPQKPDHLLAGTNWDGMLFYSQESEINWKRADHLEGEGLGIHEIAFAPGDPQTVYAGSAGFGSAGSFDLDYPGAGIRRSTDGGLTWQEANDSLSQDAAVFGLAVSPESPEIVYAGTSNHGLLKTIDGGKSWVSLDLGREHLVVMAVAVHPHDGNKIYAGALNAGLYISEDSGKNWKQASIGLNPETTPTSIVFDPTNPEVVYLSDLHSGVYRSEDSGSTWFQINDRLANRAINRLGISKDGLHLYAASEGMGVFRLDLNNEPPALVQVSPQGIEEPAESEEAAQPTSLPAEVEEPAAITPEEETPPQEKSTGAIPRLCSSLFGLIGLTIYIRMRGWK